MAPRDAILIRNERVKLFSGFFTAIGIGMIGFALLRPATEDFSLVGGLAWLWGIGGLAMIGLAYYILGYLKKETVDER
jgi:hypothetical protein